MPKRWIDQLWERHYQQPQLSRTVEIVRQITAHNAFTPAFQHFRFYANGTESGSSPYGGAAEDANVTVDVTSGDVQIHLRVMIEETGGDTNGSTNDDWGIERDLNGVGYSGFTNSGVGVRMDTASSLTDDAATTNRATNGISDGSGTFVAGQQQESVGAETSSQAVQNHQLTAGNFTEHVFAMLLVAADLTDGDFIDFRCALNGGSPGMTNNVTPRITITKVTPPPVLPRLLGLPIEELKAHRSSSTVFERRLTTTFPPPPSPVVGIPMRRQHPQHLREPRTSAVLLDPKPVLFVLAPSDIIMPAPIAATFITPAPDMSLAALSLTPAPIAGTFAAPAPDFNLTPINLAPAPIVGTFLMPTPDLNVAEFAITPAPIVGTFAVPGPTLNLAGIALTPGAIVATFLVPSPEISSGVIMLPAPITATFAVPAPTAVLGGLELTPAPVAATFAIPVADFNVAAVTLDPTPIAATFAVPSPDFAAQNILLPGFVVATFTVPAPGLEVGGLTLTPGSLVGRFVIPAPDMEGGATVMLPGAVQAIFIIPPPTLEGGAGPVTLLPRRHFAAVLRALRWR